MGGFLYVFLNRQHVILNRLYVILNLIQDLIKKSNII